MFSANGTNSVEGTIRGMTTKSIFPQWIVNITLAFHTKYEHFLNNRKKSMQICGEVSEGAVLHQPPSNSKNACKNTRTWQTCVCLVLKGRLAYI